MSAVDVLIRNHRGLYTVPAGGLYPHQWSWDSAFIAIGWRHVSPRRAQQELESLFSAQWADGRLPQIVFDPWRDADYSPGAAFWRSHGIPGSAVVPSSGLIQPPNHAWAAWLVHEADPVESRRRGFLRRAYPRLLAWHAYLATRRDRGDSGLISILHPWESGMDNSPYWDAALARIDAPADGIPRPDLLHADHSERPSNAEYGKYLHLAARYRDHDCDDADDGFPFVLEDPAVNALWARSERALASIAAELGLDGSEHLARADAIIGAMDRLWSDELGCYTARDVRTDALQPFRTVSGLIPLLAGSAHRDVLLSTLDSEHFGLGRVRLVPSADLVAPGFDPSRYWRGPSWFNTAWLIAQGLLAAGRSADATALSAQMTAAAAASGDYPEYVDPHTGAPKGTRAFSWTAALVLDLERTL